MRDRVQAALEKIRPALQSHGGDIELVDINEDEGLVTVKLQGACEGCMGAKMTMKMGVERILKEEIPEINAVEAV